MRHALFLPLFSIGLLTAGFAATAGRTDAGGFRISDFAAALNADQGWAGALNENVSIQADRPFRVRFEVAQTAESAPAGRLGLQFRRNGGEWTAVEAHDFPKPEAELDLDFTKAAVGATPAGWQIVRGKPGNFVAAADGERRHVRARADQEPLLALRAAMGADGLDAHDAPPAARRQSWRSRARLR